MFDLQFGAQSVPGGAPHAVGAQLSGSYAPAEEWNDAAETNAFAAA